MRRMLTPARLAVSGLVLLAVVAGVLAVAPANGTYIFLPDEAHALEPLVTVEGRRPPPDPGGIYFVDVIVRKATLIERFFPGIREGSSLVPAHAINPTGISDEARRKGNLREMTRSQEIAAAVALRELGFDVTAKPTGVLVAQVLPGSPAAGKLQPTDVIMGVDGRAVRTPGELRRRIGDREPGATVRLRVRRGEEIERVAIATAADPRDPGRPVIGILVEQAAEIELPVSVRINTGSVGGPSAGLAFALQLLEEFGRDVDRGYKVAVTGEIGLDGTVEPVGGVRQKAIGARDSGIEVLVVPAGENAVDARRHANGLRVVSVRSFQQALRALATLPRKR